MGNQQLDQLAALKERLKVKKLKTSQRLAEIDKQLEAVSVTISLLNRGEDADEAPANIPNVSARDLQGMKQIDALIYIAKHNNNRLRIVDAKKLLGKAGVMKVSKNSYGVLYTVITRSGRFKRSAPGEYELEPAFELRVAN